MRHGYDGLNCLRMRYEQPAKQHTLLLQRGPAGGLRYSVDLRTQTYTERVRLKYGKLAAQSIRGYTDIFYSVE